jgi:hypothetical protein
MRVYTESLQAAALSLNPAIAIVAQRELRKREKQREADARYRATHYDEILVRDRAYQRAYRARNGERLRAAARDPRRKLLREAWALHLERRRPLGELHALLGVKPLRAMRCRCAACKESA